MDWSGIEGSYWRLRKATWDDEPAMVTYARSADPTWVGIASPAPPGRPREVLGEFLKGSNGDFGLVHFAATKTTNAIIGMVGAQHRDADTVEIVYGVAPAWRGRGLATEILAAVTRTALALGDRQRCELVIDADNLASVRVAEKCGYHLLETRHSTVEATGQTFEDLVYIAKR